MAAPEVRAVGTVEAKITAITPPAPAGLIAGDLMFMVTESGGATTGSEATPELTAAGWLKVATAQKGNTRLTLLMKRSTGLDVRVTNDTGDHQVGRIIAIKAGTWDTDNTINAESELGTQSSTKSVSIPGGTSTVAECLILACASGDLPDATNTTEWGTPTPVNANLASLTGRVFNATAEGDGGAIFLATGTLATVKAWGATTLTAVTAANRGVFSIAVAPFKIPESPYHVGTANHAEAEGTSIEISKPTGSVEKDILLVSVTLSANKVLTCEGGTLIGTQKAFSTARTATWWVKHDGTAGKIKITWEGAATTFYSYAITAWRNCHQTEPVHKFTEPHEVASNVSAAVEKLTTTVNNCRIVITETNPEGNEPQIVTDPWTSRSQSAPSFADRILATAGETAAATWTLSVARVHAVQTIALQPPVTATAGKMSMML